MGSSDYVQKLSTRIEVPKSDVSGRSGGSEDLRTVWVRARKKQYQNFRK
jgi:hypothetical protein